MWIKSLCRGKENTFFSWNWWTRSGLSLVSLLEHYNTQQYDYRSHTTVMCRTAMHNTRFINSILIQKEKFPDKSTQIRCVCECAYGIKWIIVQLRWICSHEAHKENLCPGFVWNYAKTSRLKVRFRCFGVHFSQKRSAQLKIPNEIPWVRETQRERWRKASGEE